MLPLLSRCAQANDLRRELNVMKEINGKLRDESQLYRVDGETLRRQLETAEANAAALQKQLSAYQGEKSTQGDQVDKLKRMVRRSLQQHPSSLFSPRLSSSSLSRARPDVVPILVRTPLVCGGCGGCGVC